jgi:hypothetical protein
MAMPRRHGWLAHNGLKSVINFVLLIATLTAAAPRSLLQAAFAVTAAYELIADPVALSLTGRTRALHESTAHHVLVMMWAIALLDEQCGAATRDVAFIVAARTVLYGGVLVRRIRLAAGVLVGVQFAGLLASPMLGGTPACSPFHAAYIAPIQTLFVGTIVTRSVWLWATGSFGLVLVHRDAAGAPVLRPLWVPPWARAQ